MSRIAVDSATSPIDASQCPSDLELVAFVSEGDIYIARTGHPTHRATVAQPGTTNGTPAFVTEVVLVELDEKTPLKCIPGGTGSIHWHVVVTVTGSSSPLRAC
jgi:hypothetical protein